MLLAVDVGNTFVKLAVFEQYTLLEQFSFTVERTSSSLHVILEQYSKCTDLVVSSVGIIAKDVFLSFENRVKVTFIEREATFPFKNLYETPETLGIDRMVLAAGAVLTYPKQNRLVIDAGTCITYDFINSKDEYLGGAISPGIQMRYQSMHQFTAKLPLLQKEVYDDYIGKSTSNAMHAGVVLGVQYEIEGFIEQYQQDYSKIIIILTGGDANFLAKRLKNTIFANSNFLLESLNQIFQYKIKK